MKLVLEEKDLMAIVSEHVEKNPFFNLKGKEVSVELFVRDGDAIEVEVDVTETTADTTVAAPKKRTRRSSAEVKAEAAEKEAETASAADEVVVPDEDQSTAEDDALDTEMLKNAPATDEDTPLPADTVIADSKAKDKSKSLFA
jgi:DNA-directed RNA polymerase specialized sigma54-like protein